MNELLSRRPCAAGNLFAASSFTRHGKGSGETGRVMSLWTIEPAAAEDDPRWLDHAVWRRVVVRAPTAARARQVAARLEREPLDNPDANQRQAFRSAFEDEKLYWVRQLDLADLPGEVAQAGVEAVLYAE